MRKNAERGGKYKKSPPESAGGRLFFILQCGCDLVLAAEGLQLLEEVVALVIDEDEGGEVLDLNLPDGFHAELGILHALDALDATL